MVQQHCNIVPTQIQQDDNSLGQQNNKATQPPNHKYQSARLQADNQKTFYLWVWEYLRVDLAFINHHDHSVEAFWVNKNRKIYSFTIEPGENKKQSSRLAHEGWARDARVDRVHPGAPSRQTPAVGPSCDGYVHQKTEEMSRFVLCCSLQLTLTCIFLFLISLIETLVAVHKTIHDTTPQDISIEPKICLDLASSCGPWKQKAGCDLSQMKEHCQ